MNRICLVLATVLCTWSVSAGIISTEFFSTEAEAMAAIEAGPFFTGRGETGVVSINDEFSSESATELINTIDEGEVQPFQFTYNVLGMAEMRIDSIDADIDPVETPFEDSGFDAILIHAHSSDPNNLAVTVSGLMFFGVDSTSAVVTSGATGEAWLLITTDLDLSAGFTLLGAATFDHAGFDPTGDDLYFTVAPVRVPEPHSLVLLALGGLALAIKRR